MATAPRPGAGKRAAADQAVASFKVKGETFTFRFNDITAKLVSECRRVTGFTPVQLFNAFGGESTDLDVIAALMWVARRQAGTEVDYDQLLGEVTYAWLETFELTDDEAEEVVGSPET